MTGIFCSCASLLCIQIKHKYYPNCGSKGAQSSLNFALQQSCKLCWTISGNKLLKQTASLLYQASHTDCGSIAKQIKDWKSSFWVVIFFLKSFMAETIINRACSLAHRAISEALLLIVSFSFSHWEVKPQPALLPVFLHPPSLKSGLSLHCLHLPYLKFFLCLICREKPNSWFSIQNKGEVSPTALVPYFQAWKEFCIAHTKFVSIMDHFWRDYRNLSVFKCLNISPPLIIFIYC